MTALCLALASMVASAQEMEDPPCLPENLNRPHVKRFLLLEQSHEKVEEIYVAGKVPTIIGLPGKLKARGTEIGGGGQRRFDVLKGGRQILVTPKMDLVDGERFPMWITLADGMVIQLSLTRAPEGERTDGEVQIARSAEWAEAAALRSQLASMTEKARGYEVSYRQALKERESRLHALADLILGGHAKLTALTMVGNRHLPVIAGREAVLATFASRQEKEVAALLRVKNNTPQPLDLSTGRLFRLSSAEPITFALRARPSVVPPGGKGYVAVAMDSEEAFGPDGNEKVLLDFLSTHQGGELELSALLTYGHFVIQDPPSAQETPPEAPSRWFRWLF